MKLLVLRKCIEPYNDNCHECKVVEGNPNKYGGEVMRVDLWVDGGLSKEEHDTIIGKTVECDYTFPYISIAMGVRIDGK